MKGRFTLPNPVVGLVFFVTVLGGGMCLTDPVFLAISLLGATACSGMLAGRRAARFWLRTALPLMLLVAVLNPLFVHTGFVILAYLPDGNPLTMEAVVYGCASGAMLAAVLGWFYCLNEMTDSDRMLYLFGRAAPALSMLLSMTLRLIPRMRRQLGRIAEAQRGVGADIHIGSVAVRARHGMRMLSILITWALENAVETADSMKARGYGLRGRSFYAVFRFEKRDACLLGVIAAEAAAVAAGLASGALRFQYYPYIRWARPTPLTFAAGAAFLLLNLTPCLLALREEMKWRSSISAT